jgi:hypothetical protein
LSDGPNNFASEMGFISREQLLETDPDQKSTILHFSLKAAHKAGIIAKVETFMFPVDPNRPHLEYGSKHK